MEKSTNQALITLSILPLQDLTEDKRIQMFCSGLRMDLLSDLARFRSFQILPAQSLESLASPPDYLVKGIARFKGGMIQINLQLIQHKENRLVWAEKFGDSLENLFQIEEEIIRKIVVSLQQNVDYDLLTQIRKRSFTDLNAYEKWLYGMKEMKKGTAETDEQARAYFQSAIELDPSFARAYTGMSLTYFNEWSCLLWDKWDEHQDNAINWALKAVDLDMYDPLNNFILGKCYLFYKQYKKAEHYLRKALELSPLNPRLLSGISFCMAYLGFPAEALELYEKALELDPSRHGFLLTGAFVCFENGLFEQSLELGAKVSDAAEWIDFQATMAAAHFHLEQLDEMWDRWKAYTIDFQKKIRPGHEIDEAFALEWMMKVNPYQKNSLHQPFWEYLEKHLGTNMSQGSPSKESVRSVNQISREGEIWQVSYTGKSAQLPDLKGLYDIARLLGEAHTSIHCADLMDIKVIEGGAAVLDKQAKQAYQKRILDIQESLAEAEQFSHHSKIEALQQEYDDLLTHISQSVGKDGSGRLASSSVEKARSAVTWRIRSAIKKMATVHPELANHLKISIKTGLFCVYRPEQVLDWQIDV